MRGAFGPLPATPSPKEGEGELQRWEISPALRRRMKEVARRLREEQTVGEAILWQALRRKGLDGWKFRRQQLFGPFVVDFFCAAARLVVEVDGPVHEQQRDLDKERQALLETLGLRFVRVPSKQVEDDLPAVLRTLRGALTPLSLLGRGEGGEGA